MVQYEIYALLNFKSSFKCLQTTMPIFFYSLSRDIDNTPFGENMASNLGTGSWGEKRSPEEILVRWVDKETNTKEKAHLTQALWRSSKFVGCGTASKAHNDGNCHVQVCRYARPGMFCCSQF